MILAIGIIVCLIACWLWVKFVFAIFGKANSMINKKPIHEPINPYIEVQKTIMENDKNYDEYIEWMSKNGEGVPLDKIKTAEELRAESKYKRFI